MLLTDAELTERIESPLNLLNRLREVTRHKSNIVSIPPTSTEVIKDLDSKLAFGSIKSKAADIMTKALAELENRLPEVQKPRELAAVAETMNKIVTVQEQKNADKPNFGQVIIYSPQFVEENNFETIYARD